MAINKSAIMAETGLTESQIDAMKAEARENLDDDDASITDKGVAGVQDIVVDKVSDGIIVNVTGENGGTVRIGIDGVAEIEYSADGSGSIDILGLYEIDVDKQGCYFVKTYSIAGMIAFQEIELDPSCQEEKEKKEDSDVETDENDDVPDGDEEWGELGFGDDWKPTGHPYDLIIVHYIVERSKKSYDDYWSAVVNIGWEEWEDAEYSYGGFDEVIYYHYLTYKQKSIPFQIKMKVTNSEKIDTIYYYRNSDTGELVTREYHVDNPAGSFYASKFVGFKKDAADAVLYKRFVASTKTAPGINSWHGRLKDGHRNINISGSNDDTRLVPSRRYEFSRHADKVIWEGTIDPFVKNHPSGGGPPPKKPMPKNCCPELKKLTKMVKRIHDVLDAEELEDKKLTVPNRLVAPNASGNQELKSYLDIAQYQIRMADHLGLHPFKSSLSDANAAQAGNQKVEIQFTSGTAALNKIVELLLENKGDSATRLNLQVRSAVAIAQILKVATITSKTASAIASFIGMPLKEKISKIKMPFDITLGKRRSVKGFDPTQQKEQAIEAIKMNEEASTEEILPEFLQTSEQPYVHETYDGNFPSLIQQLRGQGRNGSEKT